MFTKAEKLISFRNLKPKRKEGFLKVISIFSFVGIMLGVAILIIVMSVMNGFRTDLTNKILGLNPHVVVEPNVEKIDEDFKKKLKKKYQNFNFYESLSGEGIILGNEAAKGVMIKGVKKINIENSNLNNNLFMGNLNDFENDSLLIGNELAYNLNVKIGDKINITSSFFSSTPLGRVPNRKTFTVVGIFNSGFYEFDQNLLYINLRDAYSFFNKERDETNLEIYLDNPLSSEKIKEEIQQENLNLFVYAWTDLNKSFFSALKMERNVMFLILTLIIIVAAFNIISGMTILIKNKTKEIAILKTLGMSNLSIKKSFFLTGFTIGLGATIAGVILGIIFSLNIEQIRYFLATFFNLNLFPSDIYYLDEMPSEINTFSVSIIFLISILISSIASFLPALSISRMEATKALKYE